MPDVTPDLIFQVANGFMAAKHLFVANEVGLFVALEASPAMLDDVAQLTGIPRRTLRIVADAMVALGFLERQGDYYQNTPVSSTFLSGRTPTDLRPALRYWNQLNYQRFCKKQPIQWSKRGAHLLLQTRVKTLNGELGSMFKRWNPDMQVGELAEAA